MSADVYPEDQRIEIGALLGAVLDRWLRVAIVTLVLLGATFAILLFVPKLYESTAGLLVEQRNNVTTTRTEGGSSGPTIPVEAMMSSQIELIKSRDTLLAVVDSENLRSESEFTGVGMSPLSFILQLIGRAPEPRSVDETVLSNLLQRLSVARERDSAVISISVQSRNPELAARIANAIAVAHVNRRTSLSLSDTAEASEWLEQEIARLRVQVKAADEAVANFRVDNDLFTGTNNTSILDQELTAVSAQITEAQQRKNAAQSRANLIRQLLSAGQPIDGVQDVRNSVVIQQLSQTKASLQSELAQRSSTLLPNHPTIRALVAQVSEIDQQIRIEARRVADALEGEAQIEASLEQSLRDDLVRTKMSVSNATRNTVTLDGLQRDAKAQRDLLESYLLRYSDAVSRTEAGSALPDVRQITLAAPAASPASPKTTLILGAVAFVALTLQIGGIMFGALMSGGAITDRNAYRQPFDEDAEVDDEPPAVADLFEAEPDTAYAGEPLMDDDDSVETVDEEEQEPEPTAPVFASNAPVDPDVFPDRPVEVETDMSLEIEAARLTSGGVQDDRDPQAAMMPEPPPVRVRQPASDDAIELSNLSADIAIGRVRVVMLASLTDGDGDNGVADALIDDALRRGLSVVRIDAGSGRESAEMGLTDLGADRASFGDVVHRVREGLAEVPWGQTATLERRSMRPATLIEALTDIYEVVIVMTGRIGMSSTLPMFSGIPCRLVLVGFDQISRDTVEAAIEDAANLGYEVGQIVRAPQRQTEVA